VASKKKPRMQWCRVDLHVHTPASADYLEPDVTLIQILRKAEQSGLDILAFTDHNTVGGYAAMLAEIEKLSFLERLGRAQADELRLLAEYRRLLDKVLVLPGFEFTATFGFHILGIFAPMTPIRQLEHLLLSLNVPLDAVDIGDSEVGASSDVLTAYRVINEAGGICIAAHANTSHGVAMRGLDFGGQTRMAYTQDRNLHALEVTDLGRKGRNSTQRFFDGTIPEYPRRMRCIQGSDAHSIGSVSDKYGKTTRFGVGERATEVLLPERSFEAMLEMFRSADFSRSRPYNPSRTPYDFIQAAREEGPSLVQSFHESMARRGNKLYDIVADVCAFANTNGGTVYVGLDEDPKKPATGVSNVQDSIKILNQEIGQLISPTLEVEIDAQETHGKSVIRIQVPFGEERPYAIEDNKIYVRDEAETSLAVRDEIVNLVKQGQLFQDAPVSNVAFMPGTPPVETLPEPPAETESAVTTPPRVGVEIIGSEQRNDTRYYIMRDLRNGNIVKNVTRRSARRLWHYAIKENESNPVDADRVQWQGDIGLWKRYKRGSETRYDLVQREANKVRVYYGVTDGGMHSGWSAFLAPEEQ
jgi:hypothetical protein